MAALAAERCIELKRCIERKETALRVARQKLESTQVALDACSAELEAARAEGTRRVEREGKARRQAEGEQSALGTALDQAHGERDELRLLLHRVAEALEEAGGRPEGGGRGLGGSDEGGGRTEGSGRRGLRIRHEGGGDGGGGGAGGALSSTATTRLHMVAGADGEAAGGDEDLQVSALAQSLLQLSPEQLGLMPRAEIGAKATTGSEAAGFGGSSENAPPQQLALSTDAGASQHQKQLRTALSEPLDAQAAFTIFSRLLQQQGAPSQRAAPARAADELVRLALTNV